MSRSLLLIAGVVSIAAVINGQCATADNANCANWKRNGFCTNQAYAKTMLQQYCPIACGNESGCNPTTSPGTGTNTTTAEENANCQKWAESKDTMFCASATITLAQKKTFCKKVCAADIAMADDCGVYLLDADKVKPLAASKTAATVALTNAATPITIAAIYAKEKCKIDMYADAAPSAADLADATKILQTLTGSATVVTAKADAAAAGAQSYLCTCTP
ncbi:hypothetical protein PENTCL1PPCAC_28592 [Pristionchus entomophagus]|uniref:ShKT domain-containing protein n=1 Tax=Pristionchus entomophagus TaxID=358040 RepID=A0AAV5UJA5_9BILA|nr:hypothetical protein PENTCL1PPCAC_28592 [Pristionchus entomophagus]